jgi:hypothetical protein
LLWQKAQLAIFCLLHRVLWPKAAEDLNSGPVRRHCFREM